MEALYRKNPAILGLLFIGMEARPMFGLHDMLRAEYSRVIPEVCG